MSLFLLLASSTPHWETGKVLVEMADNSEMKWESFWLSFLVWSPRGKNWIEKPLFYCSYIFCLNKNPTNILFILLDTSFVLSYLFLSLVLNLSSFQLFNLIYSRLHLKYVNIIKLITRLKYLRNRSAKYAWEKWQCYGPHSYGWYVVCAGTASAVLLCRVFCKSCKKPILHCNPASFAVCCVLSPHHTSGRYHKTSSSGHAKYWRLPERIEADHFCIIITCTHPVSFESFASLNRCIKWGSICPGPCPARPVSWRPVNAISRSSIHQKNASTFV